MPPSLVLEDSDASDKPGVTLDDLISRKQRLILKRDNLLKQVEEVELEITVVQCQYGTLYNRASILSRVPNEILCLIFQAARDLNIFDGMVLAPIAEVAISHVCSRWRQVALSFPDLWTVFSYEGPGSPRVPNDRLESYLVRSVHGPPLDLWFNFTDVGEGWPEQFDMLKSVIPHISRCHQLVMLSDQDSPILELHEDLKNLGAPNLESFAMCPDMYNKLEPTSSYGWQDLTLLANLNPTILKRGAPKLRYVRLDLSSLPRCMPPLNAVTDLRIELRRQLGDVWMDWPTFVQVLTLPSLERLSIYGQFMYPAEDNYNHQTITMSRLKHLRYGGEHASLDIILPYLSAPLLETLTFGELEFQSPPHPQPETSDLHFPSLHTLAMLNIREPLQRAFIPYLAGLTSGITSLIISHQSDPDVLLEINRKYSNQAEVLWPRVKVLTCNLDAELFFNSCHDFYTSHPDLKAIRVPESTMESWFMDDYELNELPYTFEVLTEASEILPRFWASGMECMENDDDPFCVNVICNSEDSI